MGFGVGEELVEGTRSIGHQTWPPQVTDPPQISPLRLPRGAGLQAGAGGALGARLEVGAPPAPLRSPSWGLPPATKPSPPRRGGREERDKGEAGGGTVGTGALAPAPRRFHRLLNSSFFLLQSIWGARLLVRFWWARSLATASGMSRSRREPDAELRLSPSGAPGCGARGCSAPRWGASHPGTPRVFLPPSLPRCGSRCHRATWPARGWGTSRTPSLSAALRRSPGGSRGRVKKWEWGLGITPRAATGPGGGGEMTAKSFLPARNPLRSPA